MVERFDPELVYEPYGNGQPMAGMAKYSKGDYIYYDDYKELVDKYNQIVQQLGDMWREA